MATNNRRVAAYFPPEVDEAFRAFKIQNGFATDENPSQNDSKALIHILKAFLDIDYSVAHSVSLPDNLVTTEQIEALRQEFNSRISKLLDSSQKLTQRIESLEVSRSSSEEVLQELNSELSKSLSELSVSQEAPGQLSVLDESDANEVSEIIEAQAYSELGISEESVPAELLKGLSGRQLESRLNAANRRHIYKQREHPDFPSWSAEKDKDGIPWIYRDKKFYPYVESTTSRGE